MTLLVYLKGLSEDRLKLILGVNDVYQIMKDIDSYGLKAFEHLNAEHQNMLLNTYFNIYFR